VPISAAGRARKACQNNRGDQRAQFAQHRHAGDVRDQFLLAEVVQRRGHLQDQDHPHGTRNQRDNEHRPHADADDLRNDCRSAQADLAVGERPADPLEGLGEEEPHRPDLVEDAPGPGNQKPDRRAQRPWEEVSDRRRE